MQSVEMQARTVDEAIQLALQTLNRPYNEVDVEVLRPGTPGVLGVGAENAMVRVTVRASAMRQQSIPTAIPSTSIPSIAIPSTNIAPQPLYPGQSGIAPVRPQPLQPIAPAAPIPPMPPQSQPPMANPDQVGNLSPFENNKAGVNGNLMEGAHAPGKLYDPNELANIGKEVISNLLRRMRIQSRVQIEILAPEIDENGEEDAQSPVAVINLIGPDLGVLIGRRGEALTDLQYVFNLMMNKRTRSWGKVVLDVEGYRSRRKASLISLAHRMAEQVSASRQPITLEPMPAHERRMVHIALLDHPYIRSESFGVGEERKVTLFPK